MIPEEGRYNRAGVVYLRSVSGELLEPPHVDLCPRLQQIVHPDNQVFEPGSTDNWSRLAWRKLGDGTRWWIIADYSLCVDPFSELHPLPIERGVTQLAVGVAAGRVAEIFAKDTRRIRQGMILRVRNLDIGAPAFFDATVTGVYESGRVAITPVEAMAIPAELSRVAYVEQPRVLLTCPSVNRVFLESLQFADPLGSLEV